MAGVACGQTCASRRLTRQGEGDAGAIFQASPASLRSPMPRLLMSPQQRALPQQAAVLTSPQPQQGAVMMMSPQPQHGIAAGSVDRFGHLSQRFNDLYSKSPAPKVLNQLQATSSSSSTTELYFLFSICFIINFDYIFLVKTTNVNIDNFFSHCFISFW